MAEDDFLKSLVKKALVSAASAAGSKIGGVAASYVLDLLGLGNNDLDEIKAELDTISDQVKKTNSNLSALMDAEKWNHATDSFDTICAAITTHTKRVADLMAISDNAKRDAQITKYITTANPPINGLDTNLTLLDNRIMGAGDGLTGTKGDPLMKTYLDTHWASVWDKSPAKSYANIMAVYLKCAQMQRLATTLLVAYWTATDQTELAADAPAELEKRLVAQFQVMAQNLPDFVALNAFTAPGLQFQFLGLHIAPSYITFQDNHLVPASTKNYIVSNLARMSADPATPNYTLTFSGALTVIEKVESVITNVITTGDPSDPPISLRTDAHLVGVAFMNPSPLIFSIETTDQLNVLRFKLADGRTLGYVDRGMSGKLLELTSTEATSSNGLVICTDFIKTPFAPQPTLSAWSRAFSNAPKGEGRFTNGYRVRYRVISVNRFGESDKGDWLLAPKSEDSQDSEFYFGNQTYYFPQIALFDSTGRTEAYRVFRQFHGGNEEEVTAGGTFTGDPPSGKPVIFDDFTL